MCEALEEMREECEKKGRERGREETKIKNAKEMLADNVAIEKVAQYSGLSLDEVLKLQRA